MFLPSRWRAAVLGLLVCGLAWPAAAQTDDADQSTAYNAIIDNIDLLVDKYTHFLVRKYDLTEEQDEYTRQLLRERTYKFLDRHEGDVRQLLDRMFDVRTGGEMTPEELIEWGRNAQPIYDSAKQLIVDGNDEWRKILTSEQRKIHDEDLELMYHSFDTTEDQLSRIVSGQMTVEEFRSPQRRRHSSRTRTTAAAPPRAERQDLPHGESTSAHPMPSKPTGPRSTASRRPPPTPDETARVAAPERAGRTPRGEPRTRERKRPVPPPRPDLRPDRGRTARPTGEAKKGSEGEWEKYVREFIEKYQLNDEQSQKAQAVLEDCKTQADRYLRGHKNQIERIDQRLEELKKSKDKDKAKAVSELTRQRTKLMDPINRIFDKQLKPRLERLPTRAQRRAAEAAAKKPGSKKTPGKKDSPKKDKDAEE
jgi:hypothetical protein